MKSKIGVIGAGSWGTAVACSLSRNGHYVQIWARKKEICQSINEDHINPSYLSQYTLPETLKASSDISEVCADKDLIILASPSIYLMQTIDKLLDCPAFSGRHEEEKPITIAILTKGFLPGKNGEPTFIVDTLEARLPSFFADKLVYVSGPSHGEEVAEGSVTGLIAASLNPMAAIRCREILKSRSLLVYSSLDVIGVQVCAAVKNVIAVGFGILDALAEKSKLFGDNTESLLLAAGLNEIQTIGISLGATHAETFTSIAGVGDLDVTCRSKFGRNRKFGREIVNSSILEKYENLDNLINRIEEVGYLPEGVIACKYVNKIANRDNLKLPICTGLYKILNKELKPEDYIEQILNGVV